MEYFQIKKFFHCIFLGIKWYKMKILYLYLETIPSGILLKSDNNFKVLWRERERTEGREGEKGHISS
jgi:hypothetical protein